MMNAELMRTAPQFVARAIANGTGVRLPQVVVEPVNMLKVPFKGRTEIISYEEAGALRDALNLALLKKSENPDLAKINAAVCAEFNVSHRDLESARRPEKITFPRHVAFWLARTLTTLSLGEIGAAYPRNGLPRDHGTILNGFKRVNARMATEMSVRDRVMKLHKQLLN